MLSWVKGLLVLLCNTDVCLQYGQFVEAKNAGFETSFEDQLLLFWLDIPLQSSEPKHCGIELMQMNQKGKAH